MATPIRIPELDQFVLTNVETTGVEIGRGAYGSVEEVKIPGATCAAKRLHEELLKMGSDQQVREWTSTFVRECTLMSQLRHPHIVQFLGIFFQPDSRLPLLVMERLITNLDSVLETTPNIPLDIKRCMLLDVARGLTFLHSHIPPIVHRDLTARNVLLNSAMVAKIADLGVARIVNIRPGQLAATMTRAPGNIVYMPPEAVEQQSRYSTAIDVFSYGNLAMFTLTQEFPELKAATYVDPNSRRVVARTEIERRMDYLEKLYQTFGNQHPLVQLVERCLKNIPEDRPSISHVVEQLLSVNPDRNWGTTKLELVKGIEEREKITEDLQLEIDSQKELNSLLRDQLDIVNDQSQVVKNLEEKISEKDFIIHRLQQQVKSLQQAIQEPVTKKPAASIPKSISIKWKECGRAIDWITPYQPPVVLNGKAYTSTVGNDTIIYTHHIAVYTPEEDDWDVMDSPRLENFSVAVVNNQLVTIGGSGSAYGGMTDKTAVWDDSSEKWLHPYPAMSKPTEHAAAIGYQHYLIVVHVVWNVRTPSTRVEILDTITSQWYVAKDSPPTTHHGQFRLSVLNDIVYVVEVGYGSVFKASLPALIAHSTSGATKKRTPTVWERLPDAPLSHARPVTTDHHLLMVGGTTDDRKNSKDIFLFNQLKKNWNKVSELPTVLPYEAFECTSLPSGELMIVGDDVVYTGTVTVQ